MHSLTAGENTPRSGELPSHKVHQLAGVARHRNYLPIPASHPPGPLYSEHGRLSQ